MENDVEIEVMGHKAKIKWIKAQLANPPFSTKDSLSVWIELDEPVDGTISFGTIIPVKNYGKEELLETIRMYAENDMQVMKERHRQAEEEREQKKAREKDLNELGEQLLQMIEK